MSRDKVVIDILQNRRSCRSFLEKDIPQDVLENIIKVGIQSASAGNFQPYSIIKITKEKTKKKLVALSGEQYYLADAPVNLLFCIDLRRLKRTCEIMKAPFVSTESFLEFWYSLFDTAICAQTISIAAESYGIRSLYIGNILDYAEGIKDLLDIPDYVIPCMLLTLGYPKTNGNTQRKLRIKDVVHNEKYRDPTDEELLEAYEYKYGRWKMKPTEERLVRLREACIDVHGKEFADECIKEIEDKGFINRLQHDFGLFYDPIEGIESSKKLLEFIKNSSFKWFEK
ncbi:nitroreductase family protein [Wukongibacter baidiensis]|uniref:nitroreductase family protein n=1 Tax=Wukongibacter baidiensis TaxID=1723361 RepID=UPI003D7FCE0F